MEPEETESKEIDPSLYAEIMKDVNNIVISLGFREW